MYSKYTWHSNHSHSCFVHTQCQGECHIEQNSYSEGKAPAARLKHLFFDDVWLYFQGSTLFALQMLQYCTPGNYKRPKRMKNESEHNGAMSEIDGEEVTYRSSGRGQTFPVKHVSAVKHHHPERFAHVWNKGTSENNHKPPTQKKQHTNTWRTHLMVILQRDTIHRYFPLDIQRVDINTANPPGQGKF